MATKSRRRPKSAYLQRGMSGQISYEDILLAQYMDQIQKDSPTREEKEIRVSPYSVTNGSSRKSRRPQSAVTSQRYRDHREVMNHSVNAWDPPQDVVVGWGDATGHRESTIAPKQRKRPTSAPPRRDRSGSLSSRSTVSQSSRTSYGSVSSTDSTRRRSKPLYKKTPPILCVRAFQNGNRDSYARVTSPLDLIQLLDACTAKLGLVSAARQLYLTDGTPVTSASQLERDIDIYVSCGEPFKDPYEALRDREEMRRAASWTLSGVILPEDKTRGKTRPTLSRRMKSLVESQKRRILVFRNGESSEGVEIVAGRFDEFLDDCTKKLNLESGARLLFDWDGKEVKSFADAPVLDRILQPMTTVVLGPVWVTKGGERFSPKGAQNFIGTLLMSTRDRLRQSRAYKEQLELRLESKSVVSKEIMSMSEEEVKEEWGEVMKHISELSAVIPTLKKQIKKMESLVQEESESTGLDTYKFSHISEINPESRLLGKQGLRVKVFENGKSDGEAVVHFNLREAEKGVQDRTQVMDRFLDTCASCQGMAQAGSGPAGRMIARRVFTRDGEEISDVQDLEYDQEIWLSYGEDFKPLHVMALQLNCDKATCMSLWGEKEIIQREPLGDDEKGKERPTLWRAVTGFPSCGKRQEVKLEMEPAQRLSYAEGLQMAQVERERCFLQFKKYESLVLYPELSLDRKRKKGDREIWPPDTQQWVINKNGLIHSRAFPQLALSLSETQMDVQLSDQIHRGWAVTVAKRTPQDPYQQWVFSPNGQIYCLAKPNVILTFVGNQQVTAVQQEDTAGSHGTSPAPLEPEEKEPSSILGNLSFVNGFGFGGNKSKQDSSSSSSSSDDSDEEKKKKKMEKKKKKNRKVEESATNNQGESAKPMPSVAALRDTYGGRSLIIAAIPKLPNKHPSSASQRWAIKQEDLSNIGQWKFSTVSNPEWNKRALSWPVTEDGTWNEEFTWPMEGFLLAFAPPVRKASDKNKTPATNGPPVRLRVLKNGEVDPSRGVTVIGPDLTNMIHDVSPTTKKHKRKSTNSAKEDKKPSVNVENGSCHPLDLIHLELQLFLDRCTEALSLPFAARRLYDESGKELQNLSSLQRDQQVYVSCGEAWSDPKLSYSEQQRRAVLTNLASDIARIRQYCALRDPRDLVLQVDGALVPGSSLRVDRCALTQQQRERLCSGWEGLEENTPLDERSEASTPQINQLLTAHERAHLRSEDRLKTLRWSWENDTTSKGDATLDGKDDEDFDNEVVFSDPHLQRKFRKHSHKIPMETKQPDPCYRQKWTYSEEFISVKGASQLVLGLEENLHQGQGGASNEVVLRKKRLEDPTQRWIITDDGTIGLRCNPQLVLTVTSPPLGNDPFSTDGQPVYGFEGSAVIVAHRKQTANGNAHQLWKYNDIAGFIEAFAADTTIKEITAANKANVCTYAVLGPREVFQPGYVFKANKSSQTFLCEACGKAVRGKHKLQRIHDSRKFSCALGKAEERGLKISGCFKCLNSKVDLSTLEAEATVELWEHQLTRLRKEGSVRTITRELHMTQSVQAVRIRAFRNGEGSGVQGEIIIGSSIHSLLDQATLRLGLTSAARRLYTARGGLIVDMSQLVKPYMQVTSCVQPDVLADELDSKAKIEEDSPKMQNGHAVDVVEEENRRYYRNSKSRNMDKLDLSRVTNSNEGLDDLEEGGGGSTYRVSEGRKETVPVVYTRTGIELPRWDTRWPVDLWVSCGEPFVPLEDADTQLLLSLKHRGERIWLQTYLEQEKHVLRQLQGRRVSGNASPPQSPRGVRAMTPAWTEPTRAEEKKGETISELKHYLSDVKCRQKQEEDTVLRKGSKASNVTSRLYSTPKTIRVKVFVNGETRDRALDVFGASVREILDNSTVRLNMSSAARRLFTLDGEEVTEIEQLKRDHLYCVSSGDGFIRARDRRHQMELKATWSRMTRHAGGAALPGSHTITVSSVSPDNTMLALPAPASPPPPPRAPTSPTRQLSFHTVQKGSVIRR